MEAKLLENEHKGDWKHEPFTFLLNRMEEELQELRDAVMESLMEAIERANGEFTDEERTRIIREAADVANFAMMIADNTGGLEWPKAVKVTTSG